MLTPPPPAPVVKVPTKRAIAAKLAAEQRKARKLHAIAERRAKAQGMDKQTFIAEIVKGNFRPITLEDIANEPDPGVAAQNVAPENVAPEIVAPENGALEEAPRA